MLEKDQISLGEKLYERKDWILGKDVIGARFVDFKKSYHIAMCVNSDYIKWTGVLMESIMMKNHWLKRSLCFHILVDKVNEEDRKKLERFSGKWEVSICLYFMNDKNMDSFSKFSLTIRNGKTIYSYYYRWIIPYVVDDGIDKVLYLDVDTVCNKNISDILMEEFEEPILAVNDHFSFRDNNAKRMKLNSENYFCGGLTYMNNTKMRAQGAVEKILRYLYDCVKNHIDLPLVEQDAANLVLQGNVKIASDLYHYSVVLESRDVKEKQALGLANNAYFVHFMGKIKPWCIEAQSYPLGKAWKVAKLQSEWKDIPYVGEWDRNKYRIAARGAYLSKDYFKWIGYKLKVGIYHFKNKK